MIAQGLLVEAQAVSAQLRKWRRGDSGATLVEYTLLLVLVVVAALGGLVYFGHANAALLGNDSNLIGHAR